MSNYNNLKTTIDANIKQNGNQEITGPILNSVLNQMVNILGTGYQFAGVATLDPATDPGTPDAKVFYIANGKGTYTNFGGIEVTEDDVVVLYYDTAWHKVATGIASQAKLPELEGEVEDIKISLDGVYEDDMILNSGINTTTGAIVTPASMHRSRLFPIYGALNFPTQDGVSVYRLAMYGEGGISSFKGVLTLSVFNGRILPKDVKYGMLLFNTSSTSTHFKIEIGRGGIDDLFKEGDKSSKLLSRNDYDFVIGISGKYIDHNGILKTSSSYSISEPIILPPHSKFSANCRVGANTTSLARVDKDGKYVPLTIETATEIKFIEYSNETDAEVSVVMAVPETPTYSIYTYSLLAGNDNLSLPKLSYNPIGQIKRENGFASILHKWGIIGTSLDSGEMDANGSLNDFYEFSWGKEFGKLNNVDVYNFSEGGQTLKGWLTYANNHRRYGNPNSTYGMLYFHTMMSDASFGFDVAQIKANSLTINLTSSRLTPLKSEGLKIKGYDVTISGIAVNGSPLKSVEMENSVGAGGYFRPVSLGYFEKEILIPPTQFTSVNVGDALTISISHYGAGAIGRPMDAYYVSLGENDISYGTYSGGAGSLSTDINRTAPYIPSVETYAGYLGCLIQRLRDIQPKCKIFIKTLYPFWTTHGRPEESVFNEVIRELPKYFDNVYVVDLAKHMHTEDKSVWEGLWLNSHLSPSGYKYLAYVNSTYIDWIIRNNMASFKDTALIGTSLNEA